MPQIKPDSSISTEVKEAAEVQKTDEACEDVKFFFANDIKELLKNWSYEQCVSIGQRLNETSDKLRWFYGELVMYVKDTWGEEMLDKFARDTGVKKVTLRRYADVARAISPELRTEFQHLSWSHFRLASGRKNPREFLEKASDDEMSIERFAKHIKDTELGPQPVRPTLYKCVTCGKWYIKGGDMCELNGEHKVIDTVVDE